MDLHASQSSVLEHPELASWLDELPLVVNQLSTHSGQESSDLRVRFMPQQSFRKPAKNSALIPSEYTESVFHSGCRGRKFGFLVTGYRQFTPRREWIDILEK